MLLIAQPTPRAQMLDDMLYSLSQDIDLQAAGKAAGAMASQVGGPGGAQTCWAGGAVGWRLGMGRGALAAVGQGGMERMVSLG